MEAGASQLDGVAACAKMPTLPRILLAFVPEWLAAQTPDMAPLGDPKGQAQHRM